MAETDVVEGEVVEEEDKFPNRWPKGKSGNPKGRPKRDFTVTGLSKELMNQKAEGNRSKAEMLLERLYDIGMGKAAGTKISDSVKAIQELNDRAFGKAKVILEMDTNYTFVVDWGDNKEEIQWHELDLLGEGGDDREEDTSEDPDKETSS